ncbi:MAG: aromatic ring-hydroxylating dioxygenase subunit alpha [Rhodospirillaceae bacterium]|nr:aromatic ring-hydroxylating dioxygenase subunit alpha [Rhodospirillaceae bacterium]
MGGGTIRNAWYVAAWHHELPGGAERAPLARTLLGEPVVLFRQADGTPAALEDRCPHRRLPLSMGTVVGDHLQCGYHGFTLDGTGRCVRIPGQDSIPGAARVRAYPVVEKWRWIWIWMGDPALADECTIPDVSLNDHPDWAVTEGEPLQVAGHYQLVVDNLMDGSHVSFVHKSTLGTDDVADIPVQAERDGESVRMIRWILDRPPAPLYAALGGFEGNVDRWQIITFTPPSMVVVDMGSAAAGTGAPEGDRSRGVELRSFNLITPETDRGCFYFYTHVRNFALTDEQVDKRVKTLFREAFLEDKAIIEGVQRGNERFPDSPRVDAAFDRAPMMARRIVERIAGREAAAPSRAIAAE